MDQRDLWLPSDRLFITFRFTAVLEGFGGVFSSLIALELRLT